MDKKIALGSAPAVSTIVVEKPLTLEEKVEALQKHVEELTKVFNSINSIRVKDKRQQKAYDLNSLLFQQNEANKDGIPIGISLMGHSSKNGVHVLTVNADAYYIGVTKYDSLSAAAEAASGIRRSGWTYWKVLDGRTVKEAFGKR